MFPKRTCPSCKQKTVKFISMFKNLFITNEGTKCTNCGSLILVKQEYKQLLKHLITLLQVIVFFSNLFFLYIPFTEYMNETVLRGSLILVFMNIVFLFTPNVIITLGYCYRIPIVNGTEEEIKRRNKVGIIGYLIEFGIIIGIVLLIFNLN